MENKKGSGIFLSVIGVATLVVAIIGATFAYFSATANTDLNAIAVESTTLKLAYTDVTTGLKTDMIPSSYDIANYAAFDATWTDTTKTVTVITGKDSEGKDVTAEIDAPGQCIDQNGNEICSVYEFYIANPSTTTKMDITASIVVTANDFENLSYAIYDEAGELVVKGDNPFPQTGEVALDELSQTLIPYAYDTNADYYKNEDLSQYPSAVDKSDESNANADNNVRHYKMLIWINEINDDQTNADSGKIFAAGLSIKTGGASGGVTGVIAVADSN